MMEDNSKRTECIRCGECCMNSSPTLQDIDLASVKKGIIPKANLFTIRAGEQVSDNVNEDIRVTDVELVKVKEKQGAKGGCSLYDKKNRECTIYDHRPVQCAALKCWDTNEFKRVYKEPAIKRVDIIKDNTLIGLVEEHETRCSYTRLEDLVKKIKTEGEDAIIEILETLKFDYHIRPFVSEKLGIPIEEMDFLFGRLLTDTILMFGLKVIQEEDGSFLLTAANSGQGV